MNDAPDGAPSDGEALECWSVLAGLAAAVPRLRLGSLVSPTTFHHPALLAKQACTVDRISGGRLILGIGAGWQVNEHRAYGVELPEPGPRVTRFAEAIEILRRLTTEARTTFAGEHFTLTDAPCEPKPVQSSLPIMVGTASPRMLRITARWADEWNTWGDPAETARRTELFRAACEREGRDPATVRRSAQAMVFLVDDADAAARLREKVPEGRSIVGGDEAVLEAVAAYEALGVDELIVPDFTLGPTAQARLEAYARLGELLLR
jgi:alkanesulfonate monooxygenase SsuD/methylene tetrahydromethanopterin reductase-like flavin-dependent oxidoreductase (luciferase family)